MPSLASASPVIAEEERPPPFAHAFVATDFSEGAARAVARAGRLPIAERGRITVAHVVSDRPPRKLRASVTKDARSQLEATTKRLRKMVSAAGRSDIRVRGELLEGDAYVEIIRHARSLGADLVVLGRHGRKPFRDMFIGSTAERVVRTSGLPVLVVSEKASRRYRRPLVGVALEDSCRAVVTVALRAVGQKVKIATLVHAYRVPFEGFMTPTVSPTEMTDMRKEYRREAAARLVKLKASLRDLGAEWDIVLVRADPRTAIVSEALRNQADLLAVGTHARSGLSHALLGSVAEWVVRAAPCDVLVARPVRVSFELP